uniref:FAD-dependent oxidoreductase n=1 Tax=Marinobacterium jannaschii TaxID=64970 RepID=UPI001FDEDEEC
MIEITNTAVADAVAEAQPAKEAPIVIIGSGYAGYNLAEALRQRNSEREIVLFTADDGANYSKPGLSNALARDKSADDLVTETVFEIEQRLGMRIYARCKVQSIDAEAHLLHTDYGIQAYSKLILATGAAPIRLPLQGDAADEVLSVNDLEDYRRFRAQLEPGKRVAIIGNGLIGCEFANDLAAKGYQVSVVGLTGWPMDRLLPQEIGQQLQHNLAGLGVDWHLENTVASVDKAASGYSLTLSGGEKIETDLVLSAVGLAPRTELAKSAGIECNRGIVVNGGLRTSVADIYALGDCVEIQGQLLPYLAPINFGVRALADCVLGRPTMAQYPLMPVMVKTPALPLTLVAPAAGQVGRWQVEGGEGGMRALFVDDQQQVHGFVLAGDLTSERQQWTDRITQQQALSVA